MARESLRVMDKELDVANNKEFKSNYSCCRVNNNLSIYVGHEDLSEETSTNKLLLTHQIGCIIFDMYLLRHSVIPSVGENYLAQRSTKDSCERFRVNRKNVC